MSKERRTQLVGVRGGKNTWEHSDIALQRRKHARPRNGQVLPWSRKPAASCWGKWGVWILEPSEWRTDPGLWLPGRGPPQAAASLSFRSLPGVYTTAFRVATVFVALGRSAQHVLVHRAPHPRLGGATPSPGPGHHTAAVCGLWPSRLRWNTRPRRKRSDWSSPRRQRGLSKRSVDEEVGLK